MCSSSYESIAIHFPCYIYVISYINVQSPIISILIQFLVIKFTFGHQLLELRLLEHVGQSKCDPKQKKYDKCVNQLIGLKNTC